MAQSAGDAGTQGAALSSAELGGETFELGNGTQPPEEVSAVSPSARGRPMPEIEQRYPVEPKRRLGWAVVGLGDFALNQILPAFGESEHSRLVALVSGDRDKAQQVASRYGVDEENLYDYDNYDSMADNDEIDIVFIILPVNMHAEYTIRAAKAGKHVLCEKPMAMDEQECQAMIDACRENDRQLMIAYREQYEPHNLEAIRQIQDGALGELRLMTLNAGSPVDPEEPRGQWRLRKEMAGGGSLYDIGIYALQAARYLSGEEPIEVSAMISSPEDDPRFAEVEDSVTFQLRFPSGLLATCTSSFTTAQHNMASVFGTDGTLTLEPMSDYYQHELRILTDEGEKSLDIQEISQFAAEMDHLSQVVREGGSPKTPGEEGMQDIHLMRAIYASATSGRPVRIESDYRRSAEELVRTSDDHGG
ncbi:Gfo/Idh/MocA family oxidoreductase [Halomonas sp. PA5]|nr:Gfo/Idh/MocA family oxidoreductase [Halomonas sp. PA5]